MNNWNIKEDKSKLIITILAAVILIGAGIYAYFNVLGAKYNGKYYLKSMSDDAGTVTAEEFNAMGFDASNMRIEVKFRRAYFKGWIGVPDDNRYANIKIRGNKVTYSSDKMETYGTYNNGVLTVEYNGTTMTFEKR